MAMNYSSEIRSVMDQAHTLWAQIGKSDKHEDGYRRLVTRHWGLEHKQHELRGQAAEEFAALNGWRCTSHYFFARTLARGGTHEGRDDDGCGPYGTGNSYILFDHPLFFRERARPYRAVAIVGQPYNTSIDEARAAAAEIGLALHVPSNINASWWYPGWTRFFCFTRPEITLFAGADGGTERRRWRAEVGSHEERVRGPSRKDAESAARDYDQLARKRYGDLHPAPICVQVFVTSVTISRSTAISIRADASIVANATPGRRRAEKTASAPPTKAREAGTRECPHRDPDRRARAHTQA